MSPVVSNAQSTLAGNKKDLTNIKLKGKVISNGKGIAGVAVTDGNNITTTDKNGGYELLSNSTAEFVYLSIPSGFEFLNTAGMVNFYKPITAKSGNFIADFELKKLSVDDRKHNFVVWADTQMISAADAEQLKQQSVPDLKNLVAGYPAGTLFHGIGCGDLVWDHFELFKDYKEAMERESRRLQARIEQLENPDCKIS